MSVAQQLYFAGRPRAAVGRLLESKESWREGEWVLWVKCLCELDRPDEAMATLAELDRFREVGWSELCYWLGVAAYLSGNASDKVSAAFRAAAAMDFAAAPLGLAYLCFLNKDYHQGQEMLQAVPPLAPEYALIANQIKMQIHLATASFAKAKDTLRESEGTAKNLASILRFHWQDLAWARIARAEGDFSFALQLLERLSWRLDQEELPRLYRNVSEAKRFCLEADAKMHIRLPLKAELDEIVQEAGLYRKPLLASLYDCLLRRAYEGASKEELVTSLWSESYNPLIHDDRIYKSIARLRKILGDSKKAPKILVQRGGQYCLHYAELSN